MFYFRGALLAAFAVCASAAQIPKPEDYRSDLSAYGYNATLYAGFMPFSFESDNYGSLFFWFNPQRAEKVVKGKERLVIWMNGGPGCSSIFGSLGENGPMEMQWRESYTDFRQNPYSWNEVAHVMYLEIPLRTGYTQAAKGAPIVRDEAAVATEMHQFLSSFLTVFSHLQGIPTYLSGESYAGYFVPWMAQEILKKQADPSNKMTHINLQGVTIGNGWIDEIIQTASIPQYAYVHGLIPIEAMNYLNNKWTACLDEVQFEKPNKNKPVTQTSFGNCNIEGETLDAAGRPNTFDTSTFFSYNPMWKVGGSIDNFMNDPKVQKILHVRGDGEPLPGLNFVPAATNAEFDKDGNFIGVNRWDGCVDAFDSQMKKDKPDSVVPALEYISSQIKTMLYNGEHDLTCNFLGTENVLNSRVWFNGRQWNEASRSLMRSPLNASYSDVTAEHFQLDKLSFAIVRNSGHLVPMNQPRTALDLINRFINDLNFADTPLPPAKYYTSLPTSANDKYTYYNSSNLQFSSAIVQSGALAGFFVGVIFTALVATIAVAGGRFFQVHSKAAPTPNGGGYVEIGSSVSAGESSSLLRSDGAC